MQKKKGDSQKTKPNTPFYSARRKDTLRTMKNTFARFLSIVAMTALGAMVFIGIIDTAPNMRKAIEQPIAASNLENFKVSSPLGIYDADRKILEDTKGVKSIAYGYEGDFFYGDNSDIIHVLSTTDDISKPLVESGALPQQPNEIAMDWMAEKDGYKIGDTITLRPDEKNEEETSDASAPESATAENTSTTTDGASTEETSEEDSTSIDTDISFSEEQDLNEDKLQQYTFTITAFVKDMHYLGDDRDNAAIGNGQIQYFGYVLPEAFDKSRPDFAYVQMSDFNGLATHEVAYRDLEVERTDDIQKAFANRPDEIKADLSTEANEKIADAESQIADGRQKLADAEQELKDARTELDDGWTEYRDGLRTYQDEIAKAQQEIEDGTQDLADAKKKLDDGEASYISGLQEYNEGVRTAADGKKKLDETKQTLDEAQAKIDEGRKQFTDSGQTLASLQEQRKTLVQNKADIEAGLAQIEEQTGGNLPALSDLQAQQKELQGNLSSLEDGIQQVDSGIAQAQAAITTVQGQLQQITDGIAQAQSAIDTLPGQIEQLNAGIAQVQGQIETLDAQIAQLNDGIAQANTSIETLTSQIAELQAQIDAETDPETIQALKEQLAPLQEGLTEAQATLEKLTDQLKQATAGREQAQSSLETLQGQKAEAEKGLETAKTTLATLQEQKPQAEAGLAQAQATLESLQAKKTELAGQKQQVEAGLAQIAQAIQAVTTRDALQKNLQQVNDGMAQIDKAIAGLQQLNDAQAELDKGKAQYQAGLSDYQDGQAQLRDAKSQLDSARTELDNGWKEYNDGVASLNEGRATLEEERAKGQQDLDDAKKKLDDGEVEYTDGLETYNTESAEAETNISEAEGKIADAKEAIAELKIPSYSVTGRYQDYGINTFLSEADSMDKLTLIFPTIFYLVAMLVSMTTMTRMVEEERTQIGTLKALGYTRNQIVSKYLIYGILSASIGTILGIVIGDFILMPTIFDAYAALVYLDTDLMVFQPLHVLIAFVVSLAVVVTAAWFSVNKTMKENAASLMRPEPPAKGKRILFERIRPLWSRMSFMQKITMRNLTAKKLRMWMTIIGVAGCSGLIVMGFGIQDSVNGIFDKQFGDVQHYDMQVIYNPDAPQADLDALNTYLAENTEAASPFHQERGTFRGEDGVSQDFTLMVSLDENTLPKVYTLRDRASQEPRDFSNGVLVTEKMADALHLEKNGDAVPIKDSDGFTYDLPYGGMVENYIGHNVFLSAAQYNEVFSKAPEPNTEIVKVKDPATIDQTIESLLQLDAVVSVIQTKNMQTTVTNLTLSLGLVVLLIILISSTLAFVVLYNLSNLNVSERLRELSTIKVLGFRSLEVTEYIYRESLALTVIGILFGFVAGKFMHLGIVVALSPSAAMLDPAMKITPFLISAAMTMAFSLIVMLLIHRKLKRVDMVEALKAIE